ncbi:hypothetical protein BS50DRAFT_446649, partial [Corynespora cassiicola Philippines]
MRFFPNEVILSWPTPNYVDPVTRGDAIFYVNSIFITVVVIICILRLYTRFFIKHWLGADDAFITIALILDVGLTSCVMLAFQRYGWNRHVYDIPVTVWVPTAKVLFAAKLMFVLTTGTTRLSLFALYYRLCYGITSRSYRWFLHANTAFTVASMISFIIPGILDCIPVEDYWSFSADPNNCVDEGAALVASGAITSFSDFLCTIFPIPIVLKLNLPLRQRVALAVLFSLGFVVTGAGIVRCYYSYQSLIAEYDVTWYGYPLWIATAIEVHLGIICASVPPLRPLLSKISF